MGSLCLLQSEHALAASQCDLHTDGAGLWWILVPEACANHRKRFFPWRAYQHTMDSVLKTPFSYHHDQILKSNKIKNYFNSTHVIFQNTFPQLSAGLYSSNSLFYILVTFQSMEIKEGLARRWHCKTTLDQTEALTEVNQASCPTHFRMPVHSQCI